MRKSYLICTLVLFAVLVLGYVGIGHLLNKQIRSQFTPEEYAEQQRFLYEPLDVSAEWFEVTPIPKETEDWMQELVDEFTRFKAVINDDNHLTLGKLRHGTELSQEMWQEVHHKVRLLEPYNVKAIALSKESAYDLGAWVDSLVIKYAEGDAEHFGEACNSFVLVMKSLSLRTYAMAQENEWREAFEANLAVYRLGKRHPASQIIAHLLAISMTGLAYDCTVVLANGCQDPIVLQNTLDELNRLGPQVDLDISTRIRELYLVGSLRMKKRRDKSFDLVPGKTGLFYHRQLAEHYKKRADRMAQSKAQSPAESSILFKLGRTLGFSRLVDMLEFKPHRMNLENLRARAGGAVAQYDIARLTLASRLVQLKTGESPKTMAALVPDYIPKRLKDPFAGEKPSLDTYRSDRRRNVFY
ncbi:MAG: hypothetical protein ABIH23_29960, partial [bacterium]